MVIKLYHVWMDSDIDKYEYFRYTDPRPIQSFENLDILEITSLWNFFEVVNIEEVENAKEIYLHLVNLCAKGEFDTD